MDEETLDAIKNYIDHRDTQLNQKFNSVSSVTINLSADISTNAVDVNLQKKRLAVDVQQNYLDVVINSEG